MFRYRCYLLRKCVYACWLVDFAVGLKKRGRSARLNVGKGSCVYVRMTKKRGMEKRINGWKS